MAVARVERLLRKVTRALDRAGIEYAVVGGNAVAAWVMSVDEGAVRATKDVDILLRRADLPAASAAVKPAGLVPHETNGIQMFLDKRRPNPRTGVHIIFAEEKLRDFDVHLTPAVDSAVRGEFDYAVLDLPALVRMKLMAFRDVDRVHLRDLLSLKLINAKLIRRLPRDLQARLRDILSKPE